MEDEKERVMDIYIHSEIGVCNEFEPKQKGAVSIVISPLRIEGKEGHLKVVSGCNMWTDCRNGHCFFSAAAREREKVVHTREGPR